MSPAAEPVLLSVPPGEDVPVVEDTELFTADAVREIVAMAERRGRDSAFADARRTARVAADRQLAKGRHALEAEFEKKRAELEAEFEARRATLVRDVFVTTREILTERGTNHD